MREIKFKAWHNEAKRMYQPESLLLSFDGGLSISTADNNNTERHGYNQRPLHVMTLLQFTGLQDANGVDIYEGDLLNIFFTSSDGEYIHDCIYKARLGGMGDLQFEFVNLFWINFGHNQHPSSTTLCMIYDSLDYQYDLDKRHLVVPNSYGENTLLNKKWKQNDKSKYFKVIGNIHQNPELLEKTS